jgi:hypothetical protein
MNKNKLSQLPNREQRKKGVELALLKVNRQPSPAETMDKIFRDSEIDR